MAGVQSAVGYLRKALARSVNLRNTPEITFIADRSIEYGVRMTGRIEEVVEADRRNATAAENASDEDEA